MRLLIALILSILTTSPTVQAQSKLLENVKRNPKEAKSLCEKFTKLNSANKSAGSQESIQTISTQKNITLVEAEILSMYVRGLYCPETF